MADKRKGDSQTGYGKPPKHTRFKPGQSGNRHGRPKGTQNLKVDLAEELAERIAISERGHRRGVSKQRGMLKQLIAKALRGDVRAADRVLRLIERHFDARAEAPDETLSADHQAILDAYVERRTQEKALSAPSPVLAPSDLLDDAPDEADENPKDER